MVAVVTDSKAPPFEVGKLLQEIVPVQSDGTDVERELKIHWYGTRGKKGTGSGFH
jgi:hypothetical protein